jgi:RNA polymerase sigma-70 factor (ECF subfamily)
LGALLQTIDADTFEKLLAGSPGAFRALVTIYMPMMLAAARRVLRSEADAQDAVQDAFIAASNRLNTLREPAAIGPWLRRIAINQAITRWRRRTRAAEDSIDDLLPRFDEEGWRVTAPDPPASNVEEDLSRADTQAAVRAAIDRLPDTHRMVILLRDIEGLSTAEAAERLGIEENALKVRLHRARAALRTLLEPVWKEQRA